MDLRWKNNPALWDALYQSNKVFAFSDLHAQKISSVVVNIIEAPKHLRELSGEIEDFWGRFAEQHSSAYNGKILAATGLDALTFHGEEVIIEAFISDYATSIFKSTALKNSQNLSEEQRYFFQSRFFAVGASGYSHILDEYLLGLRTDRGPADRLAGMVQYLPQGFTSVNEDNGNSMDATISRELKEETHLDIALDCATKEITHILLGELNGDFSIIYNLTLKPESREKIYADAEEIERVFFSPLSEIKMQLSEQKTRRLFSPVTVSVFESISVPEHL